MRQLTDQDSAKVREFIESVHTGEWTGNVSKDEALAILESALHVMDDSWTHVDTAMPSSNTLCLVYWGESFGQPLIGVAQLCVPHKGRFLWHGHGGSHNDVRCWKLIVPPTANVIKGSSLNQTTTAQFGGCPSCGKQTCVARQCALDTVKPVQVNAMLVEDVNSEIVKRYKVEKTKGGFWPYCVKAGDGTMDLFIGSKKQADHVQQALQSACLDGAFMAFTAAQQAQPEQFDHEPENEPHVSLASQQAQPEPVEQPIEALQKLGARLAALLDEDQWVECEALLIQAGAHQ